jgi:hypothetical protein
MASDDPNVEPDHPEPDRRELERIAFSRPRTTQDAEAAQEALRRLAARDAAATAAREPERVLSQPIPTPTWPTAESGAPFDEGEQPVQRRRSLIPLLIVVGLVLGIGAGVLVARGSPSILSGAPTPTGVATPSPRVPTLGNATRALAELASPQTADDVFPAGSFADSLDLEKTSIHRILTTTDGISLWIGRSPQDICMIYSGVPAPLGSSSGATCASILEFGDTGLSLQFGRDQWNWDGTSFTTTIAY